MCGLRDALATSRGQLHDLLQQHVEQSSVRRPTPSSTASSSRLQEQLDLANAECSALREEASELESEARELRRALEEAESAANAHKISQRQLSKSLADAQAGIKQLLAEGDAAAAAAQKAAGRIAELEEGQQRLLSRLQQVERERTDFGDMTLHANVSMSRDARCSAFALHPLSLRLVSARRVCLRSEPWGPCSAQQN